MDDLAEKLSALLDSPEGMEKVRNMAQTLLGDEGSLDHLAENLTGGHAESQNDSQEADGLPASEMALFLKASKLLKSGQEDDRTRLLLALKPHLSPPRRERVDKAVRLLKLFQLAPLLGESGLLQL